MLTLLISSTPLTKKITLKKCNEGVQATLYNQVYNYLTYVYSYFLWLGGKGSCLSMACRNTCGFLEPPKHFYLYLQAFLVKHAI